MTNTLAVRPFIDGQSIESNSTETFEVFNPSTGQGLFAIPRGSDHDIDQAVASARRAFDDGRWCDAPPSVKKASLHRFAKLIETEASALDILDAEEMGKPVSITFANAASAAGLVHFYAEAVDKLTGDVFSSDKDSFVSQRRIPYGVVGAIAPWNFPTYNALLKSVAAIAAGNCVVLKPSELSSRSAIRLGQLAIEAGLPPGVFNVVPGVGETVGRALALHPNVDMLTFTGSTAIGKRMLQYAGQSNMKPVITECGGKSPQIVFADGLDLDKVADAVAHMLLRNQGQVCSAGTRLLVQREIEAELLDKLSARFKQVVVGDPLDPKTTFGPVVSRQQCAKVMQYIQAGRDSGAELITGGQQLLQETGGYFIEPTLFRGVKPTDSLAQEEIFGPVLSTIAFDTEDEAIEIANSTLYGLAAYVWTTRLATGMKLARKIRSSIVISAKMPTGEGAGHAASSEPAGQSGIGVEGGLAGMESYLRRQMMWFNH